MSVSSNERLHLLQLEFNYSINHPFSKLGTLWTWASMGMPPQGQAEQDTDTAEMTKQTAGLRPGVKCGHVWQAEQLSPKKFRKASRRKHK